MAKNGTRDKWKDLVGELERSSLTTREFALERGVNPRTLTWWKSALRRETRKVEFLDVTMTADAAVRAPSRRVQSRGAGRF